MTDTPRTAAGRADHAIAWAWADGQSETAPLGDHSRNREGCEACQKIAAIEAEAAAPPPESGWPFHTNEELEALTPRKPAEPLDVERLAYMFEHGIPRGAPPNPYTPEAKWAMDYAKRFAAEYDRLAAARPEAER